VPHLILVEQIAEELTLKIVHSLDEEKWRQFIESQPTSGVFHTPEMLQVFARVKGHQPTFWATVDDSHCPLVLFLPVEVTLMGGLLRRFTTRAVIYGSVLCTPGLGGQEALRMLLRAYKQKIKGSILFTELRNLSDLSTVQPVLNDCGFIYEDHLNYLIDLDRPLEEVMQSIGRRTRKRIRRGLRKSEVSVQDVTERDRIKTCYELIRKSYIEAGVPLADQSLFEAAFDVLYPRGMVKFWLARVGQACAAASVELLYKDVVYGWYGGVDRAYADYTPGELLMWHILKWSVENGYKVYDFGGAGRPDEEYGVRDFKAKFGGRLVNYGRNVCVHAPLTFKGSKSIYQVVRRFL
jgi:serine/alanine adding enzyme